MATEPLPPPDGEYAVVGVKGPNIHASDLLLVTEDGVEKVPMANFPRCDVTVACEKGINTVSIEVAGKKVTKASTEDDVDYMLLLCAREIRPHISDEAFASVCHIFVQMGVV